MLLARVDHVDGLGLAADEGNRLEDLSVLSRGEVPRDRPRDWRLAGRVAVVFRALRDVKRDPRLAEELLRVVRGT